MPFQNITIIPRYISPKKETTAFHTPLQDIASTEKTWYVSLLSHNPCVFVYFYSRINAFYYLNIFHHLFKFLIPIPMLRIVTGCTWCKCRDGLVLVSV